MNGAALLSQLKNRQILALLNICIPILVGMFIFLNPYPHVTAIKEITFYGSVLLLLVLIFLKKEDFSLRTPLSIPFLLFVIWGFFGLFFALNKGNSIHDFFVHLIRYLLIFYLLFNFFATKERLLILIWTIIISTAVYSAGMLIDFYVMQGYNLSTKLGVYIERPASNPIQYYWHIHLVWFIAVIIPIDKRGYLISKNYSDHLRVRNSHCNACYSDKGGNLGYDSFSSFVIPEK